MNFNYFLAKYTVMSARQTIAKDNCCISPIKHQVCGTPMQPQGGYFFICAIVKRNFTILNDFKLNLLIKTRDISNVKTKIQHLNHSDSIHSDSIHSHSL